MTIILSTFKCAFCRRNHLEVQLLIAGAVGYICNGCVEACVDIIIDEAPHCVCVSLTEAPQKSDNTGEALMPVHTKSK